MKPHDTIDANTALRAIAATLSGQRWDSDTLDTVAAILRQAGFVIRDEFHA